MTKTNIKNLPEGHYFTECGYSQSYPWVAIRQTRTTITLQKVMVGPDPEWKPNILPGGFAGHCTNQHEQTWMFAGVDRTRHITIRKNKRGHWVHKGVIFAENVAREFYDYNF